MQSYFLVRYNFDNYNMLFLVSWIDVHSHRTVFTLMIWREEKYTWRVPINLPTNLLSYRNTVKKSTIEWKCICPLCLDDYVLCQLMSQLFKFRMIVGFGRKERPKQDPIHVFSFLSLKIFFVNFDIFTEYFGGYTRIQIKAQAKKSTGKHTCTFWSYCMV